MTSVYELLKNDGPCLSSDIVIALVKADGISAPTARKRVSRADERIGRVYNLFPRKTIFLYVKEYFGSDEYWRKLTDALLKTSAAYGKALACLIQRGGITPEPFFQIACGAPLRLKKHISYSILVDQLLRAQLVERQYVPGSGMCIALAKGEGMYDAAASRLRARTAAEDIFLSGFENWCKNLGLISYEKAKLRNLDDALQPQVGTFCWDLTAPSYLSGITRRNTDGTAKPGFLVADILFDSNITEEGALAFITKVDTVKQLKNVGNCICFFIAESFTSQAFNLLKSKGVIPATPETLFGKEIATGLRILIETLTEAGQKAIDPETLDSLFAGLIKFEGAIGNLRGTLFEYFVADVLERTRSPIRTRLNEKIKIPEGDVSETDVIVEKRHETYFVECKGYAPYSTVPDAEILQWLTKRIPITYKYCLSHHDWKHTSIHFELWTTGKLSEQSLAAVAKICGSVKPSRYTVTVKYATEIREEVKLTKERKLQKILEQHFLSHPTLVPQRNKIPGPSNLATGSA